MKTVCLVSDVEGWDSRTKPTPFGFLTSVAVDSDASQNRWPSPALTPKDADIDESEPGDDGGGLSDDESSGGARTPSMSVASVSCDDGPRDIKGRPSP